MAIRDILFPRELEDRFQPLRILGAGGMGTVFLARDRHLDRPVAVKLLHSSRDAKLVQRMEREARTMARLSHPHVVKLYSHGVTSSGPHLASEYLEGVSLEGKIEKAEALDALRQVAEGLGALHGIGLVHRDVKPSNIMRTPEGRAVLIDLGLVLDPATTRITATGATAGTVGYLAPELLEGREATPASDWFAFGATMFVLLEGALPYRTVDLMLILSGERLPPPPFESIVPDSPLGRLMTSCLAHEPRSRPGDAVEVVAAIQGKSSSRQVLPGTGPDGPDAGSRARGHTLEPEEILDLSRSASISTLQLPRPEPHEPGKEPGPPRWPRWQAALFFLAAFLFGALLWRGPPSSSGEVPPAEEERRARARRDLLALGTIVEEIEEDPHVSETMGLTLAVPREDAEASLRRAQEVYRERVREAFDQGLLEGLRRRPPARSLSDSTQRLWMLGALLDARRDTGGAELLSELEVLGLADPAFAGLRMVGSTRLSGPERGQQRSTQDERRARLPAGGRRWSCLIPGDELSGTSAPVEEAEDDAERGAGPDLEPIPFVRLTPTNLRGNPFEDPAQSVGGSASSILGTLLTEDIPGIEAFTGSLPEIEGDLILAFFLGPWSEKLLLRLELVGGTDSLEIALIPPRHSRGLVSLSTRDKGFYLLVERARLPEGLHELRLRSVGIQPVGSPGWMVVVNALYVLEAGPLPEELEDPSLRCDFGFSSGAIR